MKMVNNDSCGVLIFSSEASLFLCHATGKEHWDLPMGRSEVGETSLETAMRELTEETGLSFPSSTFSEIGRFSFDDKKDIVLFLYLCYADSIDLSQCKCSTTDIPGELPFQEVDRYEWIPLGDVEKRVGGKLWEVLRHELWKQFSRLNT